MVLPNRRLAGSGAGPRPLGAHSGTDAATLSPKEALSSTLSVPATEPTDDRFATVYGVARLNSIALLAVSPLFAAGFVGVESADTLLLGSAGILSQAKLKASTRDVAANRKRPVKIPFEWQGSVILRRSWQSMRHVLGLIALAACRGAGPLVGPTPLPNASSSIAHNLPPLASVWGFTAPWDARSDSSVRASAPKLDAVVTGWIQLDSVTALPTLLYSDSTRGLPRAERYALITSWHGDRFHPETIRKLGGDRGALALAAARIGAIVEARGYRGVVIDFEAQSPADVELTVGVAKTIADSAKRHGVKTTSIAIPATDTAAYPTRAFLAAADYAVVMLYDEHWSTSSPGPIATTDWVRRALARRVADAGASRIVAALPVYGYVWKPNQPAQPIGFVEAARLALEANVGIARDPASLSLHAIQPSGWELWLSDAQLLVALRAEVAALGVMRVALWRLGLEDPAVWAALSR